MKIKIGIIILSLFIALGSVFAQYPSLQGVYSKIDAVLEKNPETGTVIIERLSLLAEEYKYSEKDYMLIITLKEYVEKKSNESIIGSLLGKNIPQGFGKLAKEHLLAMQEVFHLHGEENSPIWVIEFIDFQCPYCQKQHRNGILDTLEYTLFPGKVRTGVGMFPLGGSWHALAQQAAESAECAYDQGGIDAYLKHKGALYAAGLQPTMAVIKRAAKNHGLDAELLEKCVTQGETTSRVAMQKKWGVNLGVRGTPASIVIDARTGAFRLISGAQGVEKFASVIDLLLESN